MTKLADYANKYDFIRFERRDGVLVLRLHTKDSHFVFSDGAHHNLSFAFYDLAADPENKVVILTGTGDRFCADFDYGSFHNGVTDYHEWALRIRSDGRRMLAAFLDIEVPVIAAINGPAVSHSELPVLADVVLADDTTIFQDATHFLKGTAPGDGMHVIWTTLLGLNRGRYFLLTGEKLSAQKAHDLGVVGEVLPKNKLMARAWELALQWADLPRTTLIATRQSLNYEWKRLLLEQLHNGLTEEMNGIVAKLKPPYGNLGVGDLLKGG
jgi:enoyl-CoA hydratase/carnithine racemase